MKDSIKELSEGFRDLILKYLIDKGLIFPDKIGNDRSLQKENMSFDITWH